MVAKPAKDTEPDGVWLANAKAGSNADDWSQEIPEDVMPAETWHDEDKAYTKSYNSALLAGENLEAGQQMVLFDFGASRHMSAFHDQFTNFKLITPKPITITD